MRNLTTNENILFQVAFKEACIDKRGDPSVDASTLLDRSLDLYDNVLIKGLNILSERKNSTLEQHKVALKPLKTIEEFKGYQSKNALTLKSLSKEDQGELKKFCQNHFNIK